jgi:flagellar motility protein MotE (MotC chaperone)
MKYNTIKITIFIAVLLLLKIMFTASFFSFEKKGLNFSFFHLNANAAQNEKDNSDNKDEKDKSDEKSKEKDQAKKKNLEDKANKESQNLRVFIEGLENKKKELKKYEETLKIKENQLKAIKQEIEIKLDELKNIRIKLEKNISILEEREKNKNIKAEANYKKKMKHLVKIYTSMKPKTAASLINNMNIETILALFDKMKGDQIGKILTYVDKSKAALISEKLAPKKLK